MAQTVKKNKTAKGEKYSYRYVDIAQIHELLESNGWSYYQYIDRMDGDDYVMTVRIIDGKEYEPLRGAKIIINKDFSKNAAQEQGSAITYARRYSLLMAFGLATTDDDYATTKLDRISANKANAFMKKCEDEGVKPEKVAELYKVKTVYFLTEEMHSNAINHWDELKERCSE